MGRSGMEPSPRGRSARAKRPPIEQLDQLLGAIYEGKFKRLTLSKSEQTVLRASGPVTDSAREVLVGVAAADRLLVNTRLLLLIAASLDDGVLAQRCLEFSREVLSRHPISRIESLGCLLMNLPDVSGEDAAIEALAVADLSSVRLSDDAERPNRTQQEACRANALQCLLLLFRMTRGMSFDRVQRHLQTHLWARAAGRYRTETAKLIVLLTTRDPAAASIACDLLERQAKEQGQRAEVARRQAELANATARDFERRLAALNVELEARLVEIETLKLEAAECYQQNRDASAVLRDDLERMRGRVLRCLNQDVSLLEEGLHALRSDPPLVHVMDDHAERVVESLRRETVRLRSDS